VTIDFGTLAASSGKQMSVTVTGITPSDQLIIRPKTSLEECILFAYCDTNDLVKIRAFNYTTAPISVNRTFVITAIKG
jgi:hypothetical protein